MLPDELRRDISWMKAEGNYVDVYGADDHRLVNYVFSRAAEELRPLGIQVHRSYWVARDNLIRVESGKGRIYAVLKGGHRVPVSRSFVREVRRAVDTRIPNE
jgi:DNA-binding LytR/AlgR family response regulator